MYQLCLNYTPIPAKNNFRAYSLDLYRFLKLLWASNILSGGCLPPGGGVLRFGLDGGVLLEPRNHTHFWGSFWPKIVPIFNDFSKNIDPFFTIFRCSHGKHPKILEIVKKMDPCQRIVVQKMGPMAKDLIFKVWYKIQCS